MQDPKVQDHHEYDHGYSQNIPAKKITGSKKRGCSAAIYLWEVITFPDYKLMSESHHHKQLKSQELRTVLESPVYDDVRREKLIYIDLPSEDLHSNHIMGQAADLKAPIDPRLTDNIKQRVHDGIFNVNEMKRHSQIFVESLFAEKIMPKRFKRSLLLVYQWDWQQKLLNRYGQEIVFLDATYRTTRYALPLFLCMPTFLFVTSTGNRLGSGGHLLNVSNIPKYVDFPSFQKWVWAFRNSLLSFVVNTNNGVEAQNKLFKYEYLAPFRVKALSGLMSTLVDNFFEDAHRNNLSNARTDCSHFGETMIQSSADSYGKFCNTRNMKPIFVLTNCICRYLDANVTMSAGWREGMENIPVEYHHRPAPFIKHMRVLEQKSADITVNMVTEVEGGLYEVKADGTKHTYSVFLGSEETKSIPSCTCRQFCKVHLPCKHFAAVFRHVPGVSWTSLPNFYRSHPIITVDDDCVNLLPPHTKAAEDISPSQSAINNHDCLKQATMINPVEDSSLHLASSAKSVRGHCCNTRSDITGRFCKGSAESQIRLADGCK
ncbi:uncharacterized protein LOC125372528 [Haliotis rufescens]|uniref:uncharacterized protein LOC125372528 n=1 Tax=Haliotis rufescens TaxID=6454 RepID=UPI00201F5386|nr:uncharacterized protein LOC125372528 [Haliotis rufescens]